MAMKTCPICNKKRLPDYATYCPKCGAELEQVDNMEPTMEPLEKRSKSIGDIILTIVLILIKAAIEFGIGFGVSYWLFEESITGCIIIGLFCAIGLFIYDVKENDLLKG